MKHSRFFGDKVSAVLLAMSMVCPLTAWADSIWGYHQKNDSLTNQSYSFAQSPLPQPGIYDDMMLAIVCKAHKLQAVVETEDLIASQGSRFSLDYQIDKQTPVAVTMKTFPDSKRKGYTEEFAQRMAGDLMKGQTVFIHINTMLRTVLSSSIPLDKAAASVKQVLADCGLDAAEPAASTSTYSLAEFEQALSQLSTEQRQQVLAKIQKIMQETR